MKSKCCHQKAKYDKIHGHYCSSCLLPTKVYNYKKFMVISIILISIILFSVIPSAYAPSKDFKICYIWGQTDVQLNDSCILKELISLGSPCPTIGLKQIKLESDNYKSNICLSNKNIAGIKYNKNGYCTGELHHHATYASYKDCLKDFVRIQNRMLNALDKGGYAEDSTYIKKLKQ